ncbi:thioredoxin [Arcobacteraceae bacterium]|nr:thioredoxin [Arcobacteraceae bacterium]
MGKYIELNNENFKASTTEGVALVDFWAPWCGPCRMIAPVIDELATDFDGKANICKVNTEEQGELTAEYGVRSIPTILIFKDGKIVDQIIGATTKSILEEKINAQL